MSPEHTHRRVVVITGASSGIGAALGERLARDGAGVALVARREAELLETARRCGEGALAIVADVTSRETVSDVVDQAIEHFGHIDVWVNNVGRGISRVATELTDQDIDEMMLVNVKSALYGMQGVLPHFRERGEGHIINISSMLGRMPMAPIRSAYSASKHFLNALTANFRDEVRRTHPGIQVSLVSPGIVATEFGLHAVHGGIDSRTFANAQSAEEVADTIAGVIESRVDDVYTVPGGKETVVRYYSSL